MLEKLYDKLYRIKVIFGDAAYGRKSLPEWVAGTFGWVQSIRCSRSAGADRFGTDRRKAYRMRRWWVLCLDPPLDDWGWWWLSYLDPPYVDEEGDV